MEEVSDAVKIENLEVEIQDLEDELATYEKKLAKRDKTIEALRIQLDEQSEEQQTLKDEIAELKGENSKKTPPRDDGKVSELQFLLKEKENELKSSEENNRELRSKISIMQEKHHTFDKNSDGDSSVAKLQEDLEKRDRKLEKYRKEIEALNEEVSLLDEKEAEIEKMTKELEQLKSETAKTGNETKVNELERILKRNEDDLIYSEGKNQELTNKISILEEKIRALEKNSDGDSSVAKLQEDLEKRDRKLEKYRKEIETLNEEVSLLDEKEAEIEKMTKELEQMKSESAKTGNKTKVNELERLLNEKEIELKSSEEKNGELKSKVSTLEEKMRTSENNSDGKSSVKKLQEDLEKRDKKLEKYKKEIEALNEELSTLDEKEDIIEKLAAEIETLQSENEKLQSSREVGENFSQFTEEELLGQIEELSTQVIEDSEVIEALEAKIKQQQRQIEKFSVKDRQIEDLKKEVLELKTKLDRSSSSTGTYEVSRLREANEKLQDEKEQLLTDISELERTCKNLKAHRQHTDQMNDDVFKSDESASLRAELSRKEKQLEHIERENARLKKNAEELEQKLAKRETTKPRADQNVKNLEFELEKKDRKLEKYKKEIEAMNEELGLLDEKEAEVAKLNEELESLKRENETIRNECESLKGEKARTKNNQESSIIKNLESKLLIAEREANMHKREAENLKLGIETRVSELKRELEHSKLDNENLRKENKSLLERGMKDEKTVQRNREKEGDLKDEICDLKNTVVLLEEANSGLRSELQIRQMQEMNRSVGHSDDDSIPASKETVHRNLETVNKILAKEEKDYEVKRLSDKLEFAREDIERLKTEMSLLREQMKTKDRQITNLTQENHLKMNLSKDNINMKVENQQLRLQLSNSQAFIQKLQEEISILRQSAFSNKQPSQVHEYRSDGSLGRRDRILDEMKTSSKFETIDRDLKTVLGNPSFHSVVSYMTTPEYSPNYSYRTQVYEVTSPLTSPPSSPRELNAKTAQVVNMGNDALMDIRRRSEEDEHDQWGYPQSEYNQQLSDFTRSTHHLLKSMSQLESRLKYKEAAMGRPSVFFQSVK